MIRPSAVLFDCDGVVVDSEGLTLDLLVADLAGRGLSLARHVAETDFLGGTIESVARRARAAGARLPDDWVSDFYTRMYAKLAEGTPLIPGIVSVLDRLDAAGIPYAIGSNGPPEKMHITLGQHGLTQRFNAVVSGQAIGRPKPAPDVYLTAAKACGAEPSTCVVVEDSPSGAKAALAAGIRCFGFSQRGPDAPPAIGLAALGVPLFFDMAALPALLGI